MERRDLTLKGVLTPPERAVMRRVLAEEEQRREHVVVYLSGAHAYGFPSPDSDLDLKAIHVARTEELLGLDPPPPTFDRAEVIADEDTGTGIEIDYTSNELAHALAGVLKGNGNFLERILGRLTPVASSWLDELTPLVQRSLSRRVHRHYRGFAQNQLRFLEREPTVKKLLYVLRTTVTGIHLLRTGELETDLRRLLQPYGLGDAAELIERKRAGERTALDPTTFEAWRPRVETLFERLDAAHDASPLPEAPANEAEVAAWLVLVRRKKLG